MKHVYILQSCDGDHFYVGLTKDLQDRLQKHNSGNSPHTAKYGQWQLKTYIAFSDPERAIAFEKFLKNGSGRAFTRKRL